MTPEAAVAEVAALHAVFSNWLSGQGGDFARIEAALAPGFAMVGPDGVLRDRAGTLARLAAARGAMGSGFAIAVEGASVVHAEGGAALVAYVERQWTEAGETARLSSALLAGDPPRWLWVQETWMAA
jgi:hypothetical protein